MTNEKAREYFSAYSEGTLDAGLAQSFEAKLKADSKLRAEYEQFEDTLKELEALRYEEIEVPFDLNERISAAVDKSIYDRKQTAQPSWIGWLRNLAFAGLAAAAVYGAYVSINMGKSNGPVISPVVPGTNQKSNRSIGQVEFRKLNSGIHMQYQPSSKQTVTIRGGSEGEKTVEVDESGWLNELKNEQPDSALFVVEIKGETPPMVVIVPGTVRKDSATGMGSLVEMAQALADRFGVPVVLRTERSKSELSWTFKSDDAHVAVEEALLGHNFMTDMREGILFIGDN